MHIYLYKNIKKIKQCFIIFLFFSIPLSLFSQTVSDSKVETYVRPSFKKDSINSDKKTVKLLQKEKQKAEKVSKQLKSKIKGPNTSLSALENEVLEKTDQRIDSLSKVLSTKKKGKLEKKANKKKDEIADDGKKLKNEQVSKVKDEAIGKLKDTKEAKELEEKDGQGQSRSS